MKIFFAISIALAICAIAQSKRHPELSVDGLVDEIFQLPLRAEKEVIQAFRTIYSRLGENSQISFLIDGTFDAIQDRVDQFSVSKGLDSLPFSDFLEKGIEFQNELLEATGQLPQTRLSGFGNGHYYGAGPSAYGFYSPPMNYYGVPRAPQGFRGTSYQPYGIFGSQARPVMNYVNTGNKVNCNNNNQNLSDLEEMINGLENSIDDEEAQPDPEFDDEVADKGSKEAGNTRTVMGTVGKAGTSGKAGVDGGLYEEEENFGGSIDAGKLNKGKSEEGPSMENVPQPEALKRIETPAEKTPTVVTAGVVDEKNGADGAAEKSIETDAEKPVVPTIAKSTPKKASSKSGKGLKGKSQNAKSPTVEEKVPEPEAPKPIETPVAEKPVEPETPAVPEEKFEAEALSTNVSEEAGKVAESPVNTVKSEAPKGKPRPKGKGKPRSSRSKPVQAQPQSLQI